MQMSLLKIFAVGWGILIGAILLNFLASKFGIIGWYEFLYNIGKLGFAKTLESTSPLSLIFLFIIYPFLLGLVAYMILRLLS